MILQSCILAKNWVKPKYDKYGMTQWNWRVVDREKDPWLVDVTLVVRS